MWSQIQASASGAAFPDIDTVTAWAVGARYCTQISDLAVHRQQNFCYLDKSNVPHSQVDRSLPSHARCEEVHA